MSSATSGFLGIILQGGLIGRLVKRFGEPALVAMGFVALAVGYFGLGIATSVVVLMLSGRSPPSATASSVRP